MEEECVTGAGALVSLILLIYLSYFLSISPVLADGNLFCCSSSDFDFFVCFLVV